MYKLFCCYRREDIYQNDNYISDGLEDQEVIDRAKEFIEVAKKELVKSSTMQHSISTTLYNLLCIPEFKPILNSFEVGNWIRVRVDENIYKLRLIQYEISFSNINTISVEFSDVTKIRDSLTDFQSLVKDTQSMSSSYSYISKQADAGQKASESMNNVLQNGLNSALVSIKNNDKEEVTYDKHGILCREYDDISDSYSDEQLIITHNILGYTDNGMKSVKASLGKHEYVYYNGSTFVKDIAYGLSCEFVQSGYIYGSQIISGDIYSSNYSSTVGTHINLEDGSFSFAGGKLAYDSGQNKIVLKDTVINWDTTTSPEISDIDGLDDQLGDLSDYLDQVDRRIQSFSQTNDPSVDWTTADLKTKHTGDLWFNPNDGLTKRWIGSTWETLTDSILQSLAESKAQIFTAKPTIAYYKNDIWILESNMTLNGTKYKKGSILTSTSDSSSFVESHWIEKVRYTDDSALEEYEKSINTFKDKVNTALIGSTNEIGSDYIISPKIGGGYLYIKNKSDKRSVTIDPQQTYSSSGYIFKITDKNGNVTIGADSNGNAEFTGTIKAKSLDLSGCSNKVSTDYISGLSKVATSGKASDLSGLSTVATSGKASDLTDISNYVTSSGLSKTLSSYLTTDSAKDTYVANTSVVISAPVVDTTTGITTQKITIGNKTFDYVDSGDFICTNIGIGKGSTPSATSTSTDTYVMINKDGCLTADNAVIRGTIYATNGYFSGKITSTSGSIGGWIIDSDCLKTDNGKVKLLNDGTISGAKITGASGEFTQSFNVDCYQLTGYVDNIHHINTWLNTRNTIGIDAEGTYVGMQGEDDDNNLIENFIYLQPNVLTIKSFYTNAETGEHVCKEYQGYISLEATRALVFNVLGDNNDGINFHGGDVYIQKGLNVNGEDGNVLLNCALDVYGRASLLNSTTTHMIAPEVNATYSLGDYSNKIGWSNIYLGNADNTWNGLRIFVGTEARVMCGVNEDGYMTFGNTASTMYYNCKSIGALSSGVDEAFRISPGAYTANYNTSDVYLFGRRDSRSKFIGSYLVYARTYGSAANVVVTENGVLGRSTSSSKRYKHDIREFSVDEISCLYDLPLKKFKYNNDYISKDDEYYDKDLYGFIVEDLNEVLPISVQHNLDDNGKHTIPEMWNNNIIVPCLLKLIQDLNNRLKKVEEK